MNETIGMRELVESENRFITNRQGQTVAVLLTIQEYEHYLDLLDDESDSQDNELAARLADAARPGGEERQSFQDYLNERKATHV